MARHVDKAELGAVGLVVPRDERRKAAGFVLQVAQLDQMLDVLDRSMGEVLATL